VTDYGTQKFFGFKRQGIDFLVSNMGFSIVAMEIDMASAFLLDRYIEDGQGDLRGLVMQVIGHGYSVPELYDLIMWLRDLSKGGMRVKLYGIDINNPEACFRNVEDYVAKVDPSFVTLVRNNFGRLSNRAKRWSAGPVEALQLVAEVRSLRVDERKHLVEEADKLVEHMLASRDRYVMASTIGEWELAVQYARLGRDVLADVEYIDDWHRDKCLARNVEWIRSQHAKDAKIIVWAHNGHVSRTEGRMGKYLTDHCGNGFVVIGSCFYSGEYNTVVKEENLRMRRVRPAQEPYLGTVEWYLKNADLPDGVVSLRELAKESVKSRWSMKPLFMRSVGSEWRADEFRPVVPGREYDGLLFIRHTNACKMNE
jgi:erythromycin esterase